MNEPRTKKNRTTGTKKRDRKPEERVYSLIKKEQDNTPQFKESCIVCLKVSRNLFNEIFKQNKETKNLVNTIEHDKQRLSDLLQDSKWLYNRLSVPDLYQDITIELEKSQVILNDYARVDLAYVNNFLNEQSSTKRVHLILPSFEGGWPERSSYACWNCTEKFDTTPVGLPTIYENRKTIEYRLEGNFCSYPCAARYLFDREVSSNLWNRYDLLNLLYQQICGESAFEKVSLAPPYLSLKKFGGQLSIEEYRQSHTDKTQYQIYRYPLKPCPYYLEETRKLKPNKDFIPLEEQSVKNIEQKYKLYRHKPLATKSYSIEQCMNIKYL